MELNTNNVAYCAAGLRAQIQTHMETQAIYLSIDQAIHQCLKEHSKITLSQQFLIHLRSALETTRIRRIPNSRPLLSGWSPGGGRLPFLQQKTIQAVH